MRYNGVNEGRPGVVNSRPTLPDIRRLPEEPGKTAPGIALCGVVKLAPPLKREEEQREIPENYSSIVAQRLGFVKMGRKKYRAEGLT